MCNDLNYGDQFLEPVSHAFERGDNVSAIVFKDSIGSEHRYELSTDVDWIREYLKIDTCEDDRISIFHNSEYYLKRFSDESNTAIAYAQVTDYLDGEDNFKIHRLADILKLTVFDDNSPPDYLSRICIITSSRGGSLDQSVYNAEQYIEHDSLVLLNKKFFQVFEQKQGLTKMYYTQKEGIVSFTDNTGLRLVLDRTE